MGYVKIYSFWCCGIPTKIPREPFCAWWRMLTAFVPTSAVYFCTTHGQNRTSKCGIGGFVPVVSLGGMIGSPSSFIKYLIGSTENIWSAVYMQKKKYASKTCACTISECAIVRNALHVTLTCLFISWCLGAAKVSQTQRVWYSSWNSVEVNWIPASAENISKSYHTKASIFPNLAWNISNLSNTSSVVVFSYHNCFRLHQQLKYNKKKLFHLSKVLGNFLE